MKIKLKERKSKLKTLDVAVQELLENYMSKDFNDIKEQLDEDFKELFNKYTDYKYIGYSTTLGMLDDLVIHYELKGEK